MKTTITACCLSFSLNLAYASNDDLSLSVAQTLLEEGNAKEGYAFLISDHDKNSTNPLEYRLLGLLAKDSGRPREARTYFNKVIELSDSESLTGEAKLELAYIAYNLGEGEKAKNYLSEVKNNNPPAKVGENIDYFLENITKHGTPKKWRVEGSLGWMYDSNANAGPADESVLMFGLPFTLSEDAQVSSDNAWILRLGFDHIKGLTDDVSLQTSVALNRVDYNSINSLDALILSGSVGLSWRATDQLAASVPVVADWVKIGHEDSYYSYSFGIAPQLRYIASDRLSLNIDTRFSKKQYKDQSDRDLNSYYLSPSIGYQVGKADFIRAGLSGGRDDSGIDYYSNNYWGGNISYYHAFKNGLQGSLNASYTDANYDGKEVAYTKERRDKTTRIGFDLSYKVKPIGSDIIFSASCTDNHSNLEIYKYDRTQATLSIRKSY